MKKTTLFTLTIAAIALTGCGTMHEKYKETGWYTPSGFNYTTALDHPADGKGLRPSQHYFGLSWDLK